MQEFTLIDHIGWATTNRTPLSFDAVNSLTGLVTKSYTDFVPAFAGISSQNSLDYSQPLGDISNIEQFFNDAIAITVPNNLLVFIKIEYLGNMTPFDENMIADLLSAVQLTPEFSVFLAQLNGMNPQNCLDFQYINVVSDGLMYCAKFQRDVETFLLAK